MNKEGSEFSHWRVRVLMSGNYILSTLGKSQDRKQARKEGHMQVLPIMESGGFLGQSWKGTWVPASPPPLEAHLKVPGIGVLPMSHFVPCLITIFLPLEH